MPVQDVCILLRIIVTTWYSHFILLLYYYPLTGQVPRERLLSGLFKKNYVFHENPKIP